MAQHNTSSTETFEVQLQETYPLPGMVNRPSLSGYYKLGLGLLFLLGVMNLTTGMRTDDNFMVFSGATVIFVFVLWYRWLKHRVDARFNVFREQIHAEWMRSKESKDLQNLLVLVGVDEDSAYDCAEDLLNRWFNFSPSVMIFRQDTYLNDMKGEKEVTVAFTPISSPAIKVNVNVKTIVQ